jgi:hypothetical protein
MVLAYFTSLGFSDLYSDHTYCLGHCSSSCFRSKNEGSINTFKIGSKTYIPISVIPKVHRAIFRNKVKPANVTRKITTVISINGNHFIPITNKTVKPIHLDGVTYLPVHKAPYYLDVKKPISS